MARVPRMYRKIRAEDCISLDIGLLHRKSALRSGQDSLVYLWMGGTSYLKIVASVLPEGDVLKLSLGLVGGAEHDSSVVRQIPLTSTPCHLGGSRPWFLCPTCGRRIAKLYITGVDYFVCRRCCGLAYQSQLDDSLDRTITRRQKYRLRAMGSLDTIDTFPRKPKGMHWRKYQELKMNDLKESGRFWFEFTEKLCG